ncbi:MAG TPA: tetratricopeptide repeat protein, partial [Streptosporangiaceae bacterium]
GVVGELRISDVPAGAGGGRRVRVSWREEAALPREAEAVFTDVSGNRDGERVRWYLEDYAEFPADPAPAIAQDAEAHLARQGADLFRQVFEADRDTMRVWEAAAGSLADARVEVDTDPGEGPGLAWELLRDPGRDQPVALGAGAFVRTHLRAAGNAQLPEPAGDRLRVLLVIARPRGRADVPFRSVASRLVRGGAEQMEGLDLDVLRPATFKRLSEVLRAAHAAGRPYHVVHFDGHGTYIDLEDLGFEPNGTGGGGGGGVVSSPLMYGVSVAGPVRGGQHGYLLFEDPASEQNQQLVDGPTLGRLLTGTGVPVLVLNACRSAYTEAPDHPADTPGPAAGGTGTGPAAGEEAELTEDVHARIRAYGSLAAEIADVGVPGVVAMRYNVYVVTAAQFMADLYAHLLAGRSLGQAATAARQALAADPVRQIGSIPVSLQDWTVPVIYEAAPLALLHPEQHEAPLIQLTAAETRTGDGGAGVPRPPDAGFFGRDETLLALDRAFDAQPIVLLHAFAGAGKSATAAEFARWYRVTGGLDQPDHPEWGPGAVLWSSFEHHLTADRVIGTVGDYFSTLLEASGIAWQAVTDPPQRRDLVMQILKQVPLLWIWDNVEPVTGFPEGTASDWTTEEQDDLTNLLRDLAQQTRCKILLTSRRSEHTWLGDLPARVQLPAMPVRESLQLAAALAARRGSDLATADWRPLLRYAIGNPLTITVLVGQALRENLASSEAIGEFVARLEAGEAQLEAGEDTALGRTRSLAASLSYGFAKAFTDDERAQLAVLHLFRDTADVDALGYMGDPDITGDDAVPELAGLDRDAGIALLDRAAGIGLLESLGAGSGYYQIHPALPWYFTTLYTTCYGPPEAPPAQRATRAYARAIGDLGGYYIRQAEEGRAALVVPVLGAEEANLRHALDLARAAGLWGAAVGCLQGLRVLYQRTGRDGEWARLVAAITPEFTDLATGGPLPGREDHWNIITGYRMRIALQAREWATATTLQNALIAWLRDQAAGALEVPAASLTPTQRNQIRNLGAALTELGITLRQQEDPGCLPHLQEALALDQLIGDRQYEAVDALNLGNVYLLVPGLLDLDQADRWYQRSLSLRADSDQGGLAMCHNQLGQLALRRFHDALSAGEAEAVLLEQLNTALRHYQQALELLPADDHEQRAITENQFGLIYDSVGDTAQALRHYQQSIKHEEARGNIYGAGQTRYNIALLLDQDGRTGDALQYARAALDNYQQAGPGAASDADRARQLIADLEQRGS